MEQLTIGQLAQQAGVGVETVRFYERKGLIEVPARRPSGYRQYPPEASIRLRFIRRAKELGFSLKEVKELLSLRIEPETSCGDVLGRVKTKIADVEKRIDDLRMMQRALEELARLCRTETASGDCPILDALEDGELP